MIAVADADIATTIPVPLTLDREPGTAEEPISLPEIENMIAQAMGRSSTSVVRSRGAVGYRRARYGARRRESKHFKIGKNLVVSPVGFTGKTVSLFLELTLTSRETFEGLQQFFSAPEDFFFGEAPQIRLSSLARARKAADQRGRSRGRRLGAFRARKNKRRISCFISREIRVELSAALPPHRRSDGNFRNGRARCLSAICAERYVRSRVACF